MRLSWKREVMFGVTISGIARETYVTKVIQWLLAAYHADFLRNLPANSFTSMNLLL